MLTSENCKYIHLSRCSVGIGGFLTTGQLGVSIKQIVSASSQYAQLCEVQCSAGICRPTSSACTWHDLHKV